MKEVTNGEVDIDVGCGSSGMVDLRVLWNSRSRWWLSFYYNLGLLEYGEMKIKSCYCDF
jgi:hypothetical protein